MGFRGGEAEVGGLGGVLARRLLRVVGDEAGGVVRGVVVWGLGLGKGGGGGGWM